MASTAVVAAVVAAPANAQVFYPSYLCDKFCDGRDPAQTAGDRIGVTDSFDGGVVVRLHFDDPDNMAWASIDGGTLGDQVWLDRSFDGGYDWSPYGSKLGDTSIPGGETGWRTLMYNLDEFSSSRPLEGVVRACGQVGSTISCTPWARTTQNATNNQRAAATALMEFYDIGNAGGMIDAGGSQQFNRYTVGNPGNSWWMTANDLTAIIDNIKITGMDSYTPLIGWVYAANKPVSEFGDFKNDFVDDTGWWAMAWIDAYELTGNTAYLNTAEDDANYMNSFWDSTCGGGVWWSTAKNYKNAIANELDLYVNAALHNLIPGDTTYLTQAENEWTWFSASGMINSSNLINDGLTNGTCVSNGQGKSPSPTYTYNQGVILEGLAELYKATGNTAYLTSAETLANASTSAALNPVSATAPQGELTEPAPGDDPTSQNSPMFKGAYIRGLSELNSVLASAGGTTAGPYTCYLNRQSAVAYLNDRNPADQYGFFWQGPWSSTAQNGPDQPTSGQQGSALFLANAGPAFTSPSDPAVTAALNCTS